MSPIITLLSKPSFKDDGFVVNDFEYLRDAEFQNVALEVYNKFTPARNATNKNARGLRYGIFLREEFTWLDRNQFSLPANLNSEERGVTRVMDPIPEDFLRTPQIEQLLRDVFGTFNFQEDSYARAYEAKVGAVRYNPEPGRSAGSAPAYPHKDLADGSVILLSKRNIIGGKSRIFDNDSAPRFEFDLEPGQGFSIRDADWLHYASEVQLRHGAEPGHRDILIVHFESLGR